MSRNARFWIWLNDGWVKLTLRPGQSLTHHTGGATDEGYSYTAETYSFDGQLLECESSTTASDCDGRLDNDAIHVCPLSDLRANEHDNDPDPFHPGDVIRTPHWTRRTAWQRDYAAEAAGY